jgi:hypothetical protein
MGTTETRVRELMKTGVMDEVDFGSDFDTDMV